MKHNADLIEKNQELEHIIQQLQFETETISMFTWLSFLWFGFKLLFYLVDYISMYQMERIKLNEKYKIKDEAIRSLSTQLQVNKASFMHLKGIQKMKSI